MFISFLVCFLVFSCGAVVLDSWNCKRWTQPTCSLGLSYESQVNRLGGVASLVSLGRLNQPSSPFARSLVGLTLFGKGMEMITENGLSVEDCFQVQTKQGNLLLEV